MTRRKFVLASLLFASAAAARRAGTQEAAASKLRTIAYNVYGCHGWPGNAANKARLEPARAQMPRRIGLELALYAPDIVSLSEAGEEAFVAAIADTLGMKYAYFDGGFPGAVLTRFPIRDSANYSLSNKDIDALEPFTRHAGRAVLETPDGDLIVYSAHLHPRSREVRLREIALLRERMQPDFDAGRPLLLQGDLNHTPESPEYEAWTAAGLVDTFAAKGEGNPGTVRSIQQAMRIDYVWAHGPLAGRVEMCRVLFEGAFRVNRDDPAAFALSDHLPVLAEFGGAD